MPVRILNVYLETSVFNFVFADDATDKMVNAINLREGYRLIEICSPSEVIENDPE